MTLREIDVAFEKHYVRKGQMQTEKFILLNKRNDVPLYL